MSHRAPAIICAVRNHGENGAIVRVLTAEYGLVAGYVSGGRSRIMRPILIPANGVAAAWRVRGGAQLAAMTAELVHSRAPLLAEPLAASGLDWVTALTAATLPEEHPYPAIYAGLNGVLCAIDAAPSARGWAAGLIRYEVLILSALGYGGALPAISTAWPDILARLDQSGRRLAEHLFADAHKDVMAARGRLIDRLKRAVA